MCVCVCVCVCGFFVFVGFFYGRSCIYIMTLSLLYFLVEPDREKGFHLDVEDYLSGVLILASELVRSLVICHWPFDCPTSLSVFF